jgi:hypothetical protein
MRKDEDERRESRRRQPDARGRYPRAIRRRPELVVMAAGVVVVVLEGRPVMLVVMPDLERMGEHVRTERDERGDGQRQGQCRVQGRSHGNLITEYREARKANPSVAMALRELLDQQGSK